MRRLLITAAVLAVASGIVVVARPSLASDQEDAPSLVDDPGTDIGDVYSFMRPGGTTHLVMAMTVHPKAIASTRFDEKVEYVFQIFGFDPASGYLDPTIAHAQVGCRFLSVDGGPQRAVCSVDGHAVERSFDEADAGPDTSDVRVFTGLRADPAFGDIAALKTTLSTGKLSFTDAGTNAFAGKNTLAIVVELNVEKVMGLPAAGRPLLGVSATTERVQ